MYKPVLVTPPTSFVTVSEIKAWTRQDFTDDDSLYTALISAAIAHVDGWNGCLARCLGEQVWRQDFDEFRDRLPLPLAPVISIESVKYINADGDLTTVGTSVYRLIETVKGPVVTTAYGEDWPGDVRDEDAAVRVEYKAGYESNEVPEDLKHAVMLLAAHWYEHREAVTMGGAPVEIPLGVKAILARYDRKGV